MLLALTKARALAVVYRNRSHIEGNRRGTEQVCPVV